MDEKIRSLIDDVDAFDASSREQAEAFRLKYLSKKGIIASLFADMKNVQPAERKQYGLVVNELKTKAEQKFHRLSEKFEAATESTGQADLSLPAVPMELGSRHPVSVVRRRILDIFGRIGYDISEGPEI